MKKAKKPLSWRALLSIMLMLAGLTTGCDSDPKTGCLSDGNPWCTNGGTGGAGGGNTNDGGSGTGNTGPCVYPQVNCGGTICTNVLVDSSNCGACGISCGTNACVAGKCIAGCTPSPEVCDGLDNNCNGLVDENYFTGTDCLVGVGACQRKGTWICDGTGGVKCSAIPGAPSVEKCDGVDNNCDGTADEGLACGFVSAPEICDGIDNDLDGIVDNGFPVGAPCTAGIGACTKVGIYLCDGTGGIKCSTTPGAPSPEKCDGVDNNCNGTADEGLSCTCSSSPEVCDGIDNDCDGLVDEGCPLGDQCEVGVGACKRVGIYVVDGAGGVKCSATPGAPGVEICNGIDDNCNGAADESLTCGFVPTPELCDGVDNNLNGTVDEGFGLGSNCSVGIGACQRTGLVICNGPAATTCSATAGMPGVEVCNGIDDDCDGLVDEGLSCACSAKPESCDGIDNDCDGSVDEGFPIGTVCQVGVGACQRFGFIACEPSGGAACNATPGTPTAEICNGIDDDCDGVVDNGISCPVCAVKTEICDGVDNDCDETVDEGFPVGSQCTVGTGACAQTGFYICDPITGGVKCTATPGTPGVEICNGIDDNCNGSADEGLSCGLVAKPEICDGVDNDLDGLVDEGYNIGADCMVGTGACQRQGVNVCTLAGGVTCSATPGTPGVEVCNGIDDDCDGLVDEGLSCACSPKTEVCNGVDDNCNGTADEGFPVGTGCVVGVGACQRTGILICDGLGGIKCSATVGLPSAEVCDGIDNDCDGLADEGLSCACSAKPEICDGIDNDCDGVVDEGFPVGATCSAGVGACQRLGIYVCDPTTGGVTCNAVAGTPKAETCNGIDDNCDGSVDNGISCPACLPSVEVCDGIDNDCDGLVDEDFALGTGCTVGTGACARTGVLICNSAGATTCSAVPGLPKAEICNGIDDNCNGTADDGLSCVCIAKPEICDGIDNDCNGTVDDGFAVGTPCTVGIGACQRFGVISCKPDGTAGCSATPGAPVAEVCDGVDNNCDGSVDNVLIGTCTCTPTGPEICDGIDNNCNGVVDEGFNKGDPCSVGTGACRRNGVFLCNGAGGQFCSVTAGAPSAEVCNGVDDNCNGTADEGLSCSCVPSPEVCDGHDNDCDGSVDETFAPGTTCSVGTGACQSFGYMVCTGGGASICNAVPGTPGAEVCNGIDDDCDGLIDEGLSCSCSSSGPELCNGIDDNCNGVADEGFPIGATCSVGVGACMRNGVFLCNGVGVSCSATAGAPKAEVCNGIDDDCDGLVDEGLSCACAPTGAEVCDGIDNDCDGTIDEGFAVGIPCNVGVGRCRRFGVYQCNGSGGIVCSATAGAPIGESCNGIDDDCDGIADEGLVCTCNPSPEICDGIDNDCNGSVDEGFFVGNTCQVGVGACKRTGFLVCNGLGGTTCSAVAASPTTEICGDGIDNDCDGTIDEPACSP